MNRMSLKEYKELLAKQKPGKYKNIKTVVDGITFDSQLEACRYGELKLLLRAGIIKDLELQPEYILRESFKENGKTIRAIKYVADFRYKENGHEIIEDTKGMETDIFKMKLKMFKAIYPDKDLRILN